MDTNSEKKLKKKKKCQKTIIALGMDDLPMEEDQCENDINRKDKCNELLKEKTQEITVLHEKIKNLSLELTKNQTISKSINDKLATSQTKLFEALNQNNVIKNDLKIAQKCIQQEIGDEIVNNNLSKLLSNDSQWKGRAQQIKSLQNQVADLKKQLSDPTNVKFEQKKIQLKKIESQRQVGIEEQQEKQLESMKQEINELKTKLTVQKNRNQILQTEITSYKGTFSELHKKSKNDDKMIKSLNDKIIEQSFKNKKNIERQRMENIIKEMDQKINDHILKDNENKKQIIEQNEEIQSLKIDLKNICGDFLFNCRGLKKDEFLSILNVLQYEKDNLLEHLQTLNNRINNDREQIIKLQVQMKNHQIKYNRLEYKYSELLKDQQCLKDRNKRKQRINDYMKSTLPTAASCASFCSIRNEHPLFITLGSKSVDSGDAGGVDELEFPMNYQINDLKNKLDLANERIIWLNDNISKLTHEKQKDLEIYSNLISKSKYVTIDTLSGRKQPESDSNHHLEDLPTSEIKTIFENE